MTRLVSPLRRRRSFLSGVLLLVGVLVAAAACSSSSKTTTTTSVPATTSAPTSAPSAAPTGSGPVDVLYAGSLVDLMTNDIGPGFHSATGYTFNGTSGDSGTLANEIRGKTIVGDVFISANPSKNVGLEGASNGNWVSWYALFGTSPLVLGYNPNSKFAQDLKTMPWYQVLAMPGILVGRTDPATDPKGVLTVTALQDAAKTYNLPALDTLATESSNVYPENTLVGRLQAGQLDVGFFYSVEAAAANIATVPLTGIPTLHAEYTVTVLNNAPHMAGANAFVEYLLGPDGTAKLTSAGMTLVKPPTVSGTPPASLQGVLSGG
jgi:molybdate/tungstate transport system substrate-binding protein